MANTRGTYLFWGDLSTDQAVALCSFAAQGLWMRMLCLCGLSERPGYLEVAGVPLTVHDLSTMTGHPPDEIDPLLAELERRRVFSRDKRGCIYNRRMVRDENRARINRGNGKKGGNPTLSKTKRKTRSVNPSVKPRARDLNLNPPKKTQSTASETETKKPISSPAAAVAAAALPNDWADRIQAIWNSPSLTGFGRIESWTRQGADFEHDILQVLTGITARNRSTRPEWEPRSLNYFDQAVADAMAMRTAPLPTGKVNGHSNGHANGQPASKSPFHDRWGNFDALAYYRWREAQKAEAKA